jgi:hypothetical protein
MIEHCSRAWPPGGGRPVDVSECMVCDGVSGAGGGGGGEDERVVVGSGSPRPPRLQHRGGTPVQTPSEASGRSQQRGCAASGGEGTAHRGGSNGVSCARGGGLQASSSSGGLSDRLVGDMTFGLELGGCALQQPPRQETPHEENP